MDGFVFLWRQSIESEVFQSAELWHLWTWCLMRANHKDKFVPVKTGKGTVTAKVGPGQFVFGRHRAAEALNCSPSSIRNRMLKLQEMGNILIESNSQFSIVTICNWEHYQADEKQKGQPKDNQRTTRGQPEDTDNNEDNDKKNTYGTFQNVKLTPSEHQKLVERFNGSCEEKINALSEYIESKGKRYKSHYATILTWARKDQESGKGEKSAREIYAEQYYANQ